jgi:hypothetical protein
VEAPWRCRRRRFKSAERWLPAIVTPSLAKTAQHHGLTCNNVGIALVKAQVTRWPVGRLDRVTTDNGLAASLLSRAGR